MMNRITEQDFRERLSEFGKWRFTLYPALWLFSIAILLKELYSSVFHPINYIASKFREAELEQKTEDLVRHLHAYKKVFDNTYGKLWEDEK